MMKCMDKNNILSDSQFGCRTSSSTEMAVTSIYDKLLQNLNNKKITSSIFLDLRKAFHSVHHDIILKKLHHYGFRGTILSFFEDYLNNRKICTKINGKTSSFYSVKYGVPQGSVLGPILFLLYVNNLPNVSKFETTLFADDTKINEKTSSFHSVKYAVPQGSVLGPILFLLYVNDLPNVSKFETTLFADDTNLHMSHHNIQFLQQEVSQEIKSING